MDNEKRIELFHLLRIKLDEIENILEHYGGKDNYLSTYCFGVYTPEDDEDDEEGDTFSLIWSRPNGRRGD